MVILKKLVVTGGGVTLKSKDGVDWLYVTPEGEVMVLVHEA